jgi:spermidine synthase
VEYVEIARAESARGELVLRERRPAAEDGADVATPVLELRANGVFVMDSAETTSEVALATAALELVAEPRDVLVAGLGLGFTLQAVLADSQVERCSVVEIEPALVEWMRDGTIPHGPTLLADDRANVVVADVSLALAEAREASYDLLLLDVDNGPGYLVHDGNAALYEEPFLRLTRRVLRADGALAIWSADQAPSLEAALCVVYDEVEPLTYAVDLQGREETYWLYVSRAKAEE